MSLKKRWFVLWILLVVVAAGLLGALLINTLLDPNLYRGMLEQSLSASLGRTVHIGNARWTLYGGMGVSFEDVRVEDRSGSDLLRVHRVVLQPELLPLFERKIKWKRILLDRPVLRLARDAAGRFSPLDGRPMTGEGLIASQKKMLLVLSTLFGGSLSVREGEISLSDESLGGAPLLTEVKSLQLHLARVSYLVPFPFQVSAKIHHAGKEGSIEVEGTLQDVGEDLDLSKSAIDAEVRLKGIDTSHFWPYLKTVLPIQTIAGGLDLSGRFKGTPGRSFNASAKIEMKEVVFDHPRVFASVFTPPWMTIGLDVSYDVKSLTVSSLSVELPQISVNAKGRIYGIGSEGMGIDAEARTGPFDLSAGKRLVPYRIITPGVSAALFNGEGRGTVELTSVKLSGSMAEIDHCDQPAHARALSVEMKLGGVSLKLPWQIPSMDNVKGLLVFTEGDLHLKELKGKVFHSTFTLSEGVLRRLLHVPVVHARSEGEIDLADLPSLAKTEGTPQAFSEDLRAITLLSGKAQYEISVDGDLAAPFRFQHSGVYRLSRMRVEHRRLPFPIFVGEGRVDLSNEALHWSGAKVEFGKTDLLTSGGWKRDRKEASLEILAKGKADLGDLLRLLRSPLFPEEARAPLTDIAALSGTADLSFKGRRLNTGRPLSYEIDLAPRGVEILPKGATSPLILREGSISFSNGEVRFSGTRLQSGNSLLLLDGFAREGNLDLSASGTLDLNRLLSLAQSPLLHSVRFPPEGIQELAGDAQVRLRWQGKSDDWLGSLIEGEIQWKGVSVRHREIPVRFSQMDGRVFISPEEFRFSEVRGNLGDSPVTASGALSRLPRDQGIPGKPRRLVFQISSPEMNLDSLFPKKEKGSSQPSDSIREIAEWLRQWDVSGRVEAAQLKYRGLLFHEVKTGMKTVGGKVILDPIQIKTAGGDLWGSGWAQPAGPDAGLSFEVKPRLSNMDAKVLLGALLEEAQGKIFLSGRLHLSNVDLAGAGRDLQEIKRSLHGHLKLEMENGVIERFAFLAKIFSILNVSQLFKGRVPDLTAKGLPYRQITSTIEIKDGVAMSEDFLVDSDAMRITIIGKVDLGKNQIDAKLGVHPLGTVDAVLSNIPIAGYILTGKDKAFLSYIYEVKGDLGDPKIEAVPFKSIGGGILGIFERLLETPFRPFEKDSGKE